MLPVSVLSAEAVCSKEGRITTPLSTVSGSALVVRIIPSLHQALANDHFAHLVVAHLRRGLKGPVAAASDITTCAELFVNAR